MTEDDKQLGIGQAAELLGISTSYVRTLADRGILSFATTSGGHRRFDRAVLWSEWTAFRHATPSRPEWSHGFDLAGLDESFVWGRMRDEVGVDFPENAYGILAYAVTEMVNNAIDHSSGSQVQVSAAVSDRIIDVRIADDGVGAFETIREGHGLPDAGAALVEVTKGKRTTAPDRHAGEGLFFTLRAVDFATLSANGYVLAASQAEGTDRFASGSSRNPGTVVTLRLDLDTDRTLTSVFERFAPADDDGVGGFTRTEPRISLVTYSGDFISRSEAKRFAAGLEKFETVTLDFEGVDLIGQGFADELFRVWQRDHPEVQLKVAGASRGVRLMIDRVAP